MSVPQDPTCFLKHFPQSSRNRILALAKYVVFAATRKPD